MSLLTPPPPPPALNTVGVIGPKKTTMHGNCQQYCASPHGYNGIVSKITNTHQHMVGRKFLKVSLHIMVAWQCHLAPAQFRPSKSAKLAIENSSLPSKVQHLKIFKPTTTPHTVHHINPLARASYGPLGNCLAHAAAVINAQFAFDGPKVESRFLLVPVVCGNDTAHLPGIVAIKKEKTTQSYHREGSIGHNDPRRTTLVPCMVYFVL